MSHDNGGAFAMTVDQMTAAYVSAGRRVASYEPAADGRCGGEQRGHHRTRYHSAARISISLL